MKDLVVQRILFNVVCFEGQFCLQGIINGHRNVNVTFLPLTSVHAAKPTEMSPGSNL